jgi:hypothetical protein
MQPKKSIIDGLRLKKHIQRGLEGIPVLCTSFHRRFNRFSRNAQGRNSWKEKMFADVEVPSQTAE